MLIETVETLAKRAYNWLYEALHLQLLYDCAFRAMMSLVELDVVPDCIIRRGIRYLLGVRLSKVRVVHACAEGGQAFSSWCMEPLN
jgi:hypothetical protein